MNSKAAILFAVIAMAGISAPPAFAVPIAEITYIENSLDDGSWKYNYVFANRSDTDNFLYDVLFQFENSSSLIAYSAAAGWTSFSGLGDLTSTDPLFDIAPNGTLGGFSLTFNYRAGGLPYVATFTNPDDPFSPLGFSGASTLSGATNPVPEPGTLVLLGSGLAGLVPFVRKRRMR